jgi:hypothetical protein
MRLGKRSKSGYDSIRIVSPDLKPLHVSVDTVIGGELSSDVVATILGPQIHAVAVSTLEHYADESFQYQETCQEHRASQADGPVEIQVDADGNLLSANDSELDDWTWCIRHASEFSLPSPPVRPLFVSEERIRALDQVFAETSEYYFESKGRNSRAGKTSKSSGFGKLPGWKVAANAAKFERMLDERYGMFRPIVTKYPALEQAIRALQRKYSAGEFGLLRQSDPPIPRGTAIILLFMMQRGGTKWEILVLSALFLLVGLQPWVLVLGAIVLQSLLHRRKRMTLGKMSHHIPAVDPYFSLDLTSTEATTPPKTSDKADAGSDQGGVLDPSVAAKYELLQKPVGTMLKPSELIDTALYDTLLLGFGPATLYTAALLSRAGRKVLVLSSRTDASGCLTMESSGAPGSFANVPFDVEASSNITKISKQQKLLAPALCTNTDCQGGVRFAQIGSEADGFAFEILSVPGMGTDGVGNGSRSGSSGVPFVMRAQGGLRSFMDDTALYLGDGWPGIHPEDVGDSTAGSYVAACESINVTSSLYYLSKILPDNVNQLRAQSTYEESAIRYAANFLNKCFPLNVHTRSLFAAIGMKDENLKPSQTSMAAHITNVGAALSQGEGLHYPVGGPRALCRALANIVERHGGRVLTDADPSELLFDESTVSEANPNKVIAQPSTDIGTEKKDASHDSTESAPRCKGVKLQDGREIIFHPDRFKEHDEPVIVSMTGFIHTFIHLLREDIRMRYKVPRGLPALSERRPVFHVLFALNGSASDLSLTGADFYRVPAASVASDEADPETGEVSFGVIGGVSAGDADTEGDKPDASKSLEQEINVDAVSDGAARKSSKPRGRKLVKFETGSSWMRISFPSAKDPSFEARHGNISTCVVTIEADDSFVTFFDTTKPKLFVTSKESATMDADRVRLLERVQKDLLDLYPQVEDKILHRELRGPFQRGLSHTPERYAAKGVRPQSPYPSLFLGGSDLTVGDSFAGSVVGGWLAANAVIGYSTLDHLFLGKNITSDLEQSLEPPILDQGDDETTEHLAVPY